MGDSNCDEDVTMDDAVAILKYAALPTKYGVDKGEGISQKGYLQADVYNSGDGVSGLDALAVMKFVAGELESLPESYLVPPVVTTTAPNNWNPPQKADLINEGEQIDDDTCNILINTAEMFKIDRYEIVWSHHPIAYAYAAPDYEYYLNETANPYYYMTLGENDRRGLDENAVYIWSKTDSYTEYFLIPLDEDGMEDLRLYVTR